MEQFNYLYEQNSILDDMFDKLYDNSLDDIIEKNIIELLVELGELANETRFFKYWSDKGPNDKDDILDEYADCLTMTLYFCSRAGVSLKEEFKQVNHKNLSYQFKELFRLSSLLTLDIDKDLVKEILSNVYNLGKMLEFSDEEIIEGTLKKINRNKKRFEEGF